MKIVRIIARLNVGGPARHVVWLNQALQGDEIQSVLLAGTVPEGEKDMSYFAAENSVQPIFIPEMSRELSLRDAVSLWKIYRRLLLEKPDIIHTHTAKAGTVGRVAGFLYRWLTWKTLFGRPRVVRFVHTYHGHVFHSYYGSLKTGLFLLIEKTLARFATDKIIVISRQQYREIHEQFGIGRAEQFAVVPLGIDLSVFQDSAKKRYLLRRELGAEDNEILVGLVGRLTEIKNISLILKAAKLYKENKSSDFPRLRFVIIGDGNLRASLEKEAEILDLKHLVTFLGNRNDADVFYAGLDVVALTSLNEGTPLSLIEAMANSLACISTEVGGVVDLLGDVTEEKNNFAVCERGVRTPSNNVAAFLDGLLYLANSEKIRVETGKRGKEFVDRYYSKERLVHQIKILYRELASPKSES